MSNGAFGENFPYSNFHDLNMDWIIKIAKDFLDQYTHIEEVIANGEESLENLTDSGLTQLQEKADNLEALLQDWYDTHSADIANQLAQALLDLNTWYTTHIDSFNTLYTEKIQAFNLEAAAIVAEVVSTIPQDYSALSGAVSDIYKLLPPFESFYGQTLEFDYDTVFLQDGYFNSDTLSIIHGNDFKHFVINPNAVKRIKIPETEIVSVVDPYQYVVIVDGDTKIGSIGAGGGYFDLPSANTNYKIYVNVFVNGNYATKCEVTFFNGHSVFEDEYGIDTDLEVFPSNYVKEREWDFSNIETWIPNGIRATNLQEMVNTAWFHIKIDTQNIEKITLGTGLTLTIADFAYVIIVDENDNILHAMRGENESYTFTNPANQTYAYINYFTDGSYITSLTMKYANPYTGDREKSLFAFRSVGVIGDSLSVGIIQGTPSANKYFSWPQYLGRNHGITAINMGKTGITARDWWNDPDCKPVFLAQGNQCQSYIIGLGVNDSNLSMTIGTSSDIDLTDYNNNQPSFYGWYGRIIQLIKATYANSKIFLLTMPYPYGELEGRNNYNDAIRTISTMFSNVYLIDLYEYYNDRFKTDFMKTDFTNGHFTATGYKNCATIIDDAISEYIKIHDSEFKLIAGIPDSFGQ